MSKASEIFTTVDLPMGGKATIIEGLGIHFFSAMRRAGNNQTDLVKYLIVELVTVNDKAITPDDVDRMHMRDISYLSAVVSTMLSNDPIF